MLEKKFTFDSTIWIWNNGATKGSWYFVSLPKDLSQEISDNYPFKHKGFGSVPVGVTIGESQWRTSMFPSKPYNTYILPIKKAIRMNEGLDKDELIKVIIMITI